MRPKEEVLVRTPGARPTYIPDSGVERPLAWRANPAGAIAIAIVDDDELIARTLARWLRSASGGLVSTHRALDSEGFGAILSVLEGSTAPLALVISDYSHSHTSGIDDLARVRRLSPDVRCGALRMASAGRVLVTGHVSPPRPYAQSVLHKPFGIPDLQAVIVAHLDAFAHRVQRDLEVASSSFVRGEVACGPRCAVQDSLSALESTRDTISRWVGGVSPPRRPRVNRLEWPRASEA